MAAMGDLTGHEANINEIAFCQAAAPDQLHSASSDCSVRGWDVRSGMQTEQCVLRPPGPSAIVPGWPSLPLTLPCAPRIDQLTRPSAPPLCCCRLKTPGRMELWSVSVYDNVVAAGGMSEVLFWDRRTHKVIGSFQDAHAEEVTQVTRSRSP